MNPFAKRIGIWIPNINNEPIIFKEIKNVIPNDAIAHYSLNKFQSRILLKDGSVIIFFKQSDMARSHKLDENYIFDYENFNQNFIRKVIMPTSQFNYVVTDYGINPFYFKYETLF